MEERRELTDKVKLRDQYTDVPDEVQECHSGNG